MEKKRICRHRFLAGFLAFLMFFALLFGGILMSLKNGLFGAGSIRAIAEDEKVYDTLCEMLDGYLEESFGESDLSWIIENENFEEVKKEMILFTMELAFEKTDEVNVEHIVEMLIETVDDEAEVIVDDVLDEIEDAGEDFDARDNEYVQDVIDRFGLEVDEDFYDEINSYAEDADKIDEYREDIKEEIQAEVIEPAKEQAEEMEEDLEENLREVMDEYYNSEAFDTIEMANDVLGYASAGLLFAALICFGIAAFFMLIILILYRRGIYGAFSKLAVNTGIVGVLLYLTGMVKDFAGPILDEVMEDAIKDVEEISADSIEKVIDFVIDSIFTPFTQTAIVYFIVMGVSIVIWAVAKIIYKNIQKNNTNNMNNGGTMYQTATQSVAQSYSQPVEQPYNQPAEQPYSQPVEQSYDQPVNQVQDNNVYGTETDSSFNPYENSDNMQ